jgi:hypothetical protein
MALSKQLQRIHEVIMTIKQQGGVFGRNPTFNDVTIEGQLTFDGDIDINSDLKVSGDIETTGNVIIGTSGKGIDFSATGQLPGMTSELLDDYEEGTWTANLAMSSGSVGYGSQLGKYVKVGNQVTANAWIAINSVSSPAGALSVALPFAIPSTVTRPASYVMNFNLTGVTGQTQAWVNPNTANLLLTQNDNGAGSSLDGANLQVGSELYISITYIV